MAKPVQQTAHQAQLLEANRTVIARIRDTVAPLAPHALHRAPPTGGWSVAEVLEHLIVSADSYLDVLRRLTSENAGSKGGADATWKPSLMGGLLAESLRNPRKLPAPRLYKPGPKPRADVLNEFVRRQEEVGRLLADTGELHWRAVRMRSPVMPILRMNMGDALTVLVVHAERHAGQIERVLRANQE